MTKLFKKGDKVKIPKTKSVGININDFSIQCLIEKEKHDYLIVDYVSNINAFEQRISCMFPTSKICTDFLNTDLEHYEEFPKKWAIELYPEVKKWIEEEHKTHYYSKDSENHIFHFPNWVNNNGFLLGNHTNSEVRKEYTLITLEQFKKHFLKEKQMKKQIVGYKLIKPEYEGALKNIEPYWNKELFEKHGYNLAIGSGIYYKFKKAGVLDIWFEPVYEEKKQIIKMYSSNKGEFEIEIIEGKAYYRPDNRELPKEWVKRIINSYDDVLTSYFALYNPYEIKIASIKVGCMEGTRKEDWEKVYKLLK